MDDNSNVNFQQHSKEYIRMYYDHQYDRMSSLEKQRLNVTSIVITISALVFTFGFTHTKALTLFNSILLPVLIILFNVFAIAYISRCADHENTHQKRAAQLIEKYVPELAELNKSIPWAKQRKLGGRATIQKMIHIILCLAALLPFGAYLFEHVG